MLGATEDTGRIGVAGRLPGADHFRLPVLDPSPWPSCSPPQLALLGSLPPEVGVTQGFGIWGGVRSAHSWHWDMEPPPWVCGRTSLEQELPESRAWALFTPSTCAGPGVQQDGAE